MNKKNAVKLTKAFAMLALVAILFSGTSFSVLANYEAKVSAASAKIRSAADTGSNVLASVKSGDKLDVIEDVTGTDGSTWCKVYVDANTTGYIRSDLVTKSSGSTSTAADASASTAAATTTTTAAANTDTAATAVPASEVTSIAAQSATVSANTVNVRKQASTSAAKVASLSKGAVVTATGTAKGSDGKTWYQVTFINNGSEVTGFIREDLMTLGEAAAPVSTGEEQPAAGEAPAEEVPATENEGTEAAAPAVSVQPVLPEGEKYYELKYTEGTDGVTAWYIYNNTDGYRMKLDELITAQSTNQSNQVKYEAQLKKQKTFLIVMVVLFALALTAAVIFFLKYRSEAYEYDEEDEDEDDEEEEEDEDEDEDEDVKIAPARNRRPVQGQVPAHQGRPAAPGNGRPAGANGTRPAGANGARPTGANGARPAGPNGARPTAANGARPAGPNGARPTGAGSARPAGANGARPGEGQTRRAPLHNGEASGHEAAQNGAQRRPAEGTAHRDPAMGQNRRAPHPEQGNAKKGEMPWKSKNFLTEDEDLDFSFIDDDDLN